MCLYLAPTHKADTDLACKTIVPCGTKGLAFYRSRALAESDVTHRGNIAWGSGCNDAVGILMSVPQKMG